MAEYMHNLQFNTAAPTAREPEWDEDVPFTSVSDAIVAELFFRLRSFDPHGKSVDLFLSAIRHPKFRPQDVSFTSHREIETHTVLHRQRRAVQRSHIRTENAPVLPWDVVEVILDHVAESSLGAAERHYWMAQLALVHRTWTLPCQRRLYRRLAIVGNTRSQNVAISAVQSSWVTSLELVDMDETQLSKSLGHFVDASTISICYIEAPPFNFLPYILAVSANLTTLSIEAGITFFDDALPDLCQVLLTLSRLRDFSLNGSPLIHNAILEFDEHGYDLLEPHFETTVVSRLQQAVIKYKTGFASMFDPDPSIIKLGPPASLPLSHLAIRIIGSLGMDLEYSRTPFAHFIWLLHSCKRLTSLRLSNDFMRTSIITPQADFRRALCASAQTLHTITYEGHESFPSGCSYELLSVFKECTSLHEVRLIDLLVTPRELGRRVVPYTSVLRLESPLSHQAWKNWDRAFSERITAADEGIKLRTLHIALQQRRVTHAKPPNRMDFTRNACSERGIAFNFSSRDA